MDVREVFAENLKRFRLQRGLSQTALGDAVGVSLQMIFSYEKAARFPRPETIADLAETLGVRPWQFLAGPGEVAVAIPHELVEAAAAVARAAGLKVSLPK